MKLFVTIQHPAHVHFFRHAIDELRDEGHDVYVFARRKEMAIDLLEGYDVDHEVLAGTAGSLRSMATTQAVYEARLLRRARRLEPDVVAAIGGVAAAHVAAVTGASSVVFYDTEHATLIRSLSFPFADQICTPTWFRESLGHNHSRYRGFHELAYLHPDRFAPDPSVFDDLAVTPDDRFAVLRSVDWGASHDIGNGGFEDLSDAVRQLEATGTRVLVTSEGGLPPSLRDRRVDIDPRRMHDLLAFADLFVGEGATMAAESAVLGTPAVYVNTLTMGYTDALESEFGLLFNYNGEDRHSAGLRRATSILDDPATGQWADRRATLLEATCDTTEVILDEVTAMGGAR